MSTAAPATVRELVGREWLESKRLVAVLIAVLFLLIGAAWIKTQPASWNDGSRIASIQSLVERGTWSIDESYWFWRTRDKVQLGGKFYSDKMPLLSAMGAGIYAVLHYGLGGSLSPACVEDGALCSYYWLTLILVTLPTALMLWLVYEFAYRYGVSWQGATVGTLFLGLGTMFLPYALVLNNHAPAAASLFASFYILLILARGDSRWLAVSGLFGALAVAIDPLSALIAGPIGLVALVRFRRRVVYFLLGGVPPVLLTLLFDYQITGTIFPPYLTPEGYSYYGSVMNQSLAGLWSPVNAIDHAYNLFIGRRGLFAYNPILLWSGLGAAITALRVKHALRLEAALTLLGFALASLFLTLGTSHYGGSAYGERFFIPALPTLFVFAFFIPPLQGGKRWPWTWLLLLPLVALSVISSVQGTGQPWQIYAAPLYIVLGKFPNVISFKWGLPLP